MLSTWISVISSLVVFFTVFLLATLISPEMQNKVDLTSYFHITIPLEKFSKLHSSSSKNCKTKFIPRVIFKHFVYLTGKIQLFEIDIFFRESDLVTWPNHNKHCNLT